jgi:hypothetical protein
MPDEHAPPLAQPTAVFAFAEIPAVAGNSPDPFAELENRQREMWASFTPTGMFTLCPRTS